MSIQSTHLDSGLDVVTESVGDVGSVAIGFWVGTGSRDESPGQEGMSHFLEHLLFKGSDRRSGLEIANAIDSAGGDMNAFTTKECTAFYIRVLKEDLALAHDILSDVMCAPSFGDVDFESERQVIQEEILIHNDEGSDVAHETFSQMLFADHGLGTDVLGTTETIAKADAASVRSFFRHHYRTNNLVFAAAGAVDHQEILDLVNGGWQPASGGAKPQRTAPRDARATNVVIERPGDQVHLVTGVRAPSRHSSDRYAAALLDTIFGSGVSSRLFQQVREARGLAYNVFSSYGAYDDAGEFSVYVGTAPGRTAEVEEVLAHEFEILVDHGVTDAELQRAKRNLAATTLLGLEDTLARMSRIGRSVLFHQDVLSVAEVSARINRVTIDEVNSLATQLLSSPRCTVKVGPNHP